MTRNLSCVGRGNKNVTNYPEPGAQLSRQERDVMDGNTHKDVKKSDECFY
jgi:hypothetical protein